MGNQISKPYQENIQAHPKQPLTPNGQAQKPENNPWQRFRNLFVTQLRHKKTLILAILVVALLLISAITYVATNALNTENDKEQKPSDLTPTPLVTQTQSTQQNTLQPTLSVTQIQASPASIITSTPTETLSPSPALTPDPKYSTKPKCGSPSIPPESSPAPLTVTLHGGGTAGYKGGIVGYQWDFTGDGTWDTEADTLDPV